MINKTINFIIPYFGRFPNYFQLFLNSCGYNPKFNWTIITDSRENYNFPSNVKVIEESFDETRQKIKDKFDFDIYLETPYKFCDLKPMYGYIFSEYNIGYDYWGFCDLDMILGDLSEFITNEMLEYDKIFTLGHMTIIKNNDVNNKMFMKKICGEEYYKKVLSSMNSFNFDEIFKDRININTIYNNEKIPIWTKSKIADIYTKSSNFILDYSGSVEKYRKNFFVWNRGKLKRYSRINSDVIDEEFMYIHLQKRKMKVESNIDLNLYKIIPDMFCNLEVSINDIKQNFGKVKRKTLSFHYFKLRYKNLKKKIKMMMREKKK